VATPVAEEQLPLERLKRREEFTRVAAGNRKWAMPGLVLQVLPTLKGGQRPAVRVGFTTSRKVGGAVQRNRARRRLRAAAAALLPAHGRAGHDYVLIGRTETVTRPYAQLLVDLETAMRRLRAWRDAGAGVRS
jgi:ribonuclease P protein component